MQLNGPRSMYRKHQLNTRNENGLPYICLNKYNSEFCMAKNSFGNWNKNPTEENFSSLSKERLTYTYGKYPLKKP